MEREERFVVLAQWQGDAVVFGFFSCRAAAERWVAERRLFVAPAGATLPAWDVRIEEEGRVWSVDIVGMTVLGGASAGKEHCMGK